MYLYKFIVPYQDAPLLGVFPDGKTEAVGLSSDDDPIAPLFMDDVFSADLKEHLAYNYLLNDATVGITLVAKVGESTTHD